jgi:hypothetical protein
MWGDHGNECEDMMPCCLERARRTGCNLLDSPPALHASILKMEAFARSFGLSPEYTALDSRRPYSLLKYIIWIYLVLNSNDTWCVIFTLLEYWNIFICLNVGLCHVCHWLDIHNVPVPFSVISFVIPLSTEQRVYSFHLHKLLLYPFSYLTLKDNGFSKSFHRFITETRKRLIFSYLFKEMSNRETS